MPRLFPVSVCCVADLARGVSAGGLQRCERLFFAFVSGLCVADLARGLHLGGRVQRRELGAGRRQRAHRPGGHRQVRSVSPLLISDTRRPVRAAVCATSRRPVPPPCAAPMPCLHRACAAGTGSPTPTCRRASKWAPPGSPTTAPPSTARGWRATWTAPSCTPRRSPPPPSFDGDAPSASLSVSASFVGHVTVLCRSDLLATSRKSIFD